MSDRIKIEMYIDDWDENISYGCPNLSLMGYLDIKELIKDIKVKRAGGRDE